MWHKIEVKVPLYQVIKSQRGRRGIAVLFLILGPTGVRGQRDAAAALLPGKTLGTHCTGG